MSSSQSPDPAPDSKSRARDEENADLGENVCVEPNVVLGFRYHPLAGRTRVGANSILRSGTILYGDVQVGSYFQSGHYTVIRAHVVAGHHCTVMNHSTLEGLILLGDGVRIMSHVYIPTRTRFGNHVFVGPGTTFLNARLPGREDRPQLAGAQVEDDVMIGGGCTILPGVRIGCRSFIAAGTLVTRDVPPRSFVKGSPGKAEALPTELDRENSRRLTLQSTDLWHPDAPQMTVFEDVFGSL